MHQPTVGRTAGRTRTVTARDIELRTTITRADGVVALQGMALVWREDLERSTDR